MQPLLRYLGALNFAVWLGMVLSAWLVVAPSGGSEESIGLFGPAYAGAMRHLVEAKLLTATQWCGGLALAQLIGEWLHAGRPLQRWRLFLLSGLFAAALFQARLLQPRLTQMHYAHYSPQSTPEQREAARKNHHVLNIASAALNAAAAIGLAAILWRDQREIARRLGPAGF